MVVPIQIKQAILRERLYSQMRSSRKHNKYLFPFALESLLPLRVISDTSPEYLPEMVRRFRLLENEYVVIRYLDDIFDKDLDIEKPEEYLEEIKKLVEGEKKPKNWIEESLVENRKQAARLGRDTIQGLEQSTQSLLKSWSFDINRTKEHEAGKTPTYTKKELDDYFTQMEVLGIAKGALAILGEDHSRAEELDPLITATRRNFYFLRDLAEDVFEGRINIPKETIDKLTDNETRAFEQGCSRYKNSNYENVSFIDRVKFPKYEAVEFYNSLPEPIKRWAKDQTNQGIINLRKHKKSKVSKRFSWSTRAFLKTMYEIEAKNKLSAYQKIIT